MHPAGTRGWQRAAGDQATALLLVVLEQGGASGAGPAGVGREPPGPLLAEGQPILAEEAGGAPRLRAPPLAPCEVQSGGGPRGAVCNTVCDTVCVPNMVRIEEASTISTIAR